MDDSVNVEIMVKIGNVSRWKRATIKRRDTEHGFIPVIDMLHNKFDAVIEEIERSEPFDNIVQT